MNTLTSLTTALGLLALVTPAWASGVIAGRIAEPLHVTRALVGTDSFVTTTDGAKYRLDGATASAVVASQLLAPETLLVVPAAQPVAGAGAPMALVLATPVPRTSAPTIVVLGRDGTATAVSTNLLTAEVVAPAALRPGASILVAGAGPVAVAAGPPTERVVMLRGGQSVVIADTTPGGTAIAGEVDFDPAALQPGAHVRIVRREDGRYFLSRATAPTTVALVPGGTVAAVDPASQVVTLHDGRRVDARGGASTILLVREQPLELASIRSGTIVVIDPGGTLAAEAPSALPGDVVMSGRIVGVRERTR